MPGSRRWFSSCDRAVSPTIGVLLMVALTVVLGATVYVIGGGVAGQAHATAMQATFSVDELNDRVRTVTAPPSANWAEVKAQIVNQQGAATINVGFAVPFVNDAAIGGDGTNDLSSSSSLDVASTTAKIVAGDFLEFCGSALTGQVTVRLQTDKQQIGEYVFASLDAC